MSEGEISQRLHPAHTLLMNHLPLCQFNVAFSFNIVVLCVLVSLSTNIFNFSPTLLLNKSKYQFITLPQGTEQAGQFSFTD